MLKMRLLPQIEEVDIDDLRIYLGIWLEGSCHDMCHEAREARTLFIAKLEKIFLMIDRKIVARQYDDLRSMMKLSTLNAERENMYEARCFSCCISSTDIMLLMHS